MILLADSGATKCDWCLLDKGLVVKEFSTIGINAATGGEEKMRSLAAEAALQAPEASEIHFFGAGLASKESCEKASSILAESFPKATVIECQSDILCACRALFGNKKGIAAILGTGSNSCEYDGEKIVRGVRPGGFILGDEGSGAALGQMYLADHIKGLVPAELDAKIEEESGEILSYENIVAKVYKGDAPSRYMASFAAVLGKHRKNKYVREMLEDNFRAFFERCLMQYDVENSLVGVVGGFGYEFQEILIRLGNEYGVSFIKFLKRPMEGLINYYV